MENSVIAVQIANGTFVPVLNTSSRKRRRLVVTTVRDDQTDVRIRLFRGSDESMTDPQYVGSLNIDSVAPQEGGAPDISVLLGVDESGNLNATATDTASGEYQSLSVGLDQLVADGGYDVPDFQLSDEELTVDELSMDDLSMEDLSTEDLSMDDMAMDDFSIDELSVDEPSVDEPSVDEASTDEASTVEPSTVEDDLDLDLDSLDAELAAESGSPSDEPGFDTGPSGLDEEPSTDEESGLDDLADFADEDFSFDESLSFESEPDEEETGEPAADDGLVEAELGDEDFTFDESLADELEDTLSAEEFDRLDSQPLPVESESAEEPTLEPRRSNAIIFIGYVVLALAALGVLAYLVFRLLEGPAAPPLRAWVGATDARAVALPVLALTGLRRRR